MKICTLYSGSRGNSAFLQCGNANILIDAGKSARALKQALAAIGKTPDDIDAIFITHEHSDHISVLENPVGLPNIPIHAAGGCAQKLSALPSPYIRENLIAHPPLFSVDVNDTRISSFVTPHDSACSVGYRIEWEENGITRRVGYATDVGYVSTQVTDGLCDCEAVIIEANHDVEMLEEGPYPYHLKQRILSRRGHLCNSDCALLASTLAERGTRAFLLAHLSEKNNDPAIAYDEVFAALSNHKIILATADSRSPTKLVWEE